MSTRFNAMLPFVLVAACSDGATSETSTPAAVVDTGSAEDAVVVDTGSVVVPRRADDGRVGDARRLLDEHARGVPQR